MSLDIDMENYGGQLSGYPTIEEDKENSKPSEIEEQSLQPESPLSQSREGDEAGESIANPQAEHFKALREEIEEIKAKRAADNEEYQLQLAMLRANQQPTIEKKKMFEGMDGSDVPNVDEIRREWEERESGYNQRIEELEVQKQYPDYEAVIREFIPQLKIKEPNLINGIERANNPALSAYLLCKKEQRIQELTKKASDPPTRSAKADRMIENSRKPRTLSQAGGQGALSQADYYASMSDKEFMEFASKNLDRI